jgi:hypothetical protein
MYRFRIVLYFKPLNEERRRLRTLIAAINKGAKAAQAGMLLFLLVGPYLLATASLARLSAFFICITVRLYPDSLRIR